MRDTGLIIERIREKVTIVERHDPTNNGIEKIISDVSRLITRKTLVPVICEDMYEYQDPSTKERQSLHSYIVERIIDEIYKEGKCELKMTETELKDIVNEGYYGISLLQSIYGENVYDKIVRLIMDDENNINDGICVKDEVLSFLLTCDCPLIITTNCFPILEKYLSDKYESFWNEQEERDDIEKGETDNIDKEMLGKRRQLPDKCIYHIFGEAKFDNSNWGYNDRQILKYLRLTYSDYRIPELKRRITENPRKTLLFLGNDCPDWLFRFILTPIYGGDVYDDGKGYYMSSDCSNDNCSLNHFLRDIQFDRESELIKVLREVTSKKNALKTTPSTYHNKKYDFFVAHASDNKEEVKKMVSRMREHGLKVWVDYENIKDGQYWQRIIDGLKESAYFMPYITEEYILKNRDNKKVFNAFKELHIDGISFDMEECLKLENYLHGVQIELLLANRWFENMNDKRALYSIPVLQKGSLFWGEEIDNQKIKNWSYQSKILPQSLFYGVQFNVFDELNPLSFELDWDKYKKY